MFASACSSTPPPEDPQPTTAEPKKKKKKKEVAEPLKPKCESFAEECVATGDTQAKIPGSDFVFIPPIGWVFAQESGQTVAKAKDDLGYIAVTGLEGESAGDQDKMRDATYPKLFEAIGVTATDKRKKKFVPAWGKPDEERKTGDVVVKMWQADDAKHGDQSGPLLVFMTKDTSGHALLGVAFTKSGDTTAIKAIEESLTTFGPGGYQ